MTACWCWKLLTDQLPVPLRRRPILTARSTICPTRRSIMSYMYMKRFRWISKISDKWEQSAIVIQNNNKAVGNCIVLPIHASEVLLKVLKKSLQVKAEAGGCLGYEDFGFRNGKGTRNAIGALIILAERCMENNQEVYILCFVDCTKVFDRLDWQNMMNIGRMER